MENVPFSPVTQESRYGFSVNNIRTAFLVFEVWTALMVYILKQGVGQFKWKVIKLSRLNWLSAVKMPFGIWNFVLKDFIYAGEKREISYNFFWPIRITKKFLFCIVFQFPDHGSANFSIKGQIRSILGIVGHMVSVVTATHLCHCSAEADLDSM